MSESTTEGRLGFHKGTLTAWIGGWPLVASAVFLVLGVALGTQSGLATTSPGAVTILILLATLAGGAGAVAMLRTPTAPPTRPFVALAATVAALLSLTPIAVLSTDLPFAVFVLLAPWQYALIPLAVHFAFAIGWPHRHQHWAGVVIGWYTLHLALLITAVGGHVAGEMPLLQVVDTTLRARILEPIGVVTAIGALGLALGSPSRSGTQRRATAWALAAIGLGLGPSMLALVLPALSHAIDGAMTTSRLALALVPFLGLAALVALPFVNPLQRDLLAARHAARLLDETDLTAAMRELAAALREVFEAEGASIRLSTPPIAVTEGIVRPGTEVAFAPEAETVDDQRTLVAPIGRSGDPLGEVRLDARFAGAFGGREREWLAGFLLPIATALRARRREQLLREQSIAIQRDVHQASLEIRASLLKFPAEFDGDPIAVPPAVDASEVLGQLTDGLDGVSRRADDLEGAASEARTQVREASDEVAQALDALRRFTAEMVRLGTWRDDISASNQTVSGVAFRTNLLANNAALEATRAGSAGKTFGVLAEEIRRLADATSSSSAAIDQAGASLAMELGALVEALERVQASLVASIRKSEVGEEAARRVMETAGAVLSHARSLRPAVDEAYAVARRRTDRDTRLTEMLERFTTDRDTLVQTLTNHRALLEQVERILQRIGKGGGSRR
jgi:hypothetical protein